jgi:carboxyl-terminal processing protease
LLLVVLVALFVGAFAFAIGFATHTVMVAAAPAEGVLGDENASSNEAGSAQEAARPAASTPDQQLSKDEAFKLFWEAWDLIESDFYGDLPSDEELTFGAIRGATETLGDPHTAFIDPDAAEYRRQTEGGSYEGIGAFVNMEDGRLIIVQPMKGQPAEQAGLRPGDIVLKVDDTPIENMSLYEAIALILGPAGTQVRLNIAREGEEPFDVEITRARIETPLVESEMRDDGLGYVALYGFDYGASSGLGEAIEDLLDQNPSGLILDLRGNPGGLLHEAVLTTGLFLPKDELVMIERTKEEEERLTPEMFGSDGPVALDIPMVVLVDGGSASASEILAGALQDLDRAVLIGETTFGKGSVQVPHELSNGAELRVTIARWFTPNDRAIHGEGLDPDIEVELTAEDFEAELDPQLDRAVEYLLSGE